MITFREQVQLIVYFSLFGMFLAVMYDLLNYYLNKIKINLILGYVIQFIYWLGLVLLVCLYVYKVSDGYITIYTFGFFILGILIHIYFFSDGFTKDIARVDDWMYKLYKKIKKTLIIIVFPKEVISVIKKLIPNKKTMDKMLLFFKKLVKKVIFKIKKKEKIVAE